MQTALIIFSQGCFLFNFDLKSGYDNVDIFSKHRKYLSFGWEFCDGITWYYSFCVFPFGLSSAPYLFTKLLKPVLRFWRSHGIPIVIFFDDGLGGAANELSAKINTLKGRTDLVRLGFVINEEKSHWTPVQIIVWLGLIMNTKNGTSKVTDQKITKLKSSLDSLSNY